MSGGLEIAGPWHQSPPKDFSRPELLWFSWGFEERALFVAKVRRSGPGPARIAIGGQACTDKACKNIDLEISPPLAGANGNGGPSGVNLKALLPVR